MINLFSKSKYNYMLELPKSNKFFVSHKTKYSLYIYRHLHKKMIDVIEAVFGGYPENKYIFYPPSDSLYDCFENIRLRFLEIDQSKYFMTLPVTNLQPFELNSNYKNSSHSWRLLKEDINKEQKMLTELTQFDYQLPDKLKVLFNETDILVKLHVEEKNKILNANHVSPANNYYGILFNKNSFRKKLLDFLNQNGQEATITKIVNKFNKSSNYIYIVINQINKLFKVKNQRLKIVTKNNHIYLDHS